MSSGQQRRGQPPDEEYGGVASTNIERLESKVDAIDSKLDTLNVSVAAMMPRAEVDAEIRTRVSTETYTSDQRATNERLLRLEASPARLLAWVAGGVGCFGVLIATGTLLLSVATLLFYVITFVILHP